MESLYCQSDLPPDPLSWVKLGHNIADFVFLAYISFVIAFRALECIQRYWETKYGESR